MNECTSFVRPKITVSQAVVWFLAVIAIFVMAKTDAADLLPRVAAISALVVALFATRLLPEVVTALGCFLSFIAISSR